MTGEESNQRYDAGQPATGREQITVEVRLYASLRECAGPAGEGRIELRLRSGATAAEALERLGIPAGQSKLIYVNGRRREPGHILADGDELGVFPPIAGG